MGIRHPEITKEILVQMYEREGKSSWQLADLFGCSKSTILRKLERFGIDSRDASESHAGKAIPLAVRQKMSLSAKAHQQGSSHTQWKGGRLVDARGYILIWKKGHPYASCKGYVMEHRLVMEKIMGRILLPGEVVHHINGIPGDNREENLRYYENHALHMIDHEKERKIKEACLSYADHVLQFTPGKNQEWR